MFVINVNDLQSKVSADTIDRYAGDTSLVTKELTEDVLLNRSNKVTKEAEIWITANKLKFNASKTQHLDFPLNKKKGC